MEVATMTSIDRRIMGLVVMLLMLAACGTAMSGEEVPGPDTGTSNDAAAGMCPQDQPDCIDTPQLSDDEAVGIDETGIEQLRRDARFYLGLGQDELNEHVRIGRIGDEHMMLTEDYRVGRITVELDDVDGDGVPVVTSATVELPDGPETFER
jgi:hypothetical protein